MTVTVAASPRGARIGFSSAGADGTQLVLTVAPKAWRPEGQAKHRAAAPPRADRRYVATLYETDRVHIRDNPDLTSLAERCLRRSTESQGSDPDWGEALLHPDIAPRDPDQLDILTDADMHTATDVLRLFDRAKLIQPESDPLVAELYRSPLHRPMLYRRFLDDVRRRLTSARRGYRPVTAIHTSIRGRALTSSLAHYQATGDPRIACRYAELTGSTALLGIVCAALDWIADGRSIPSPFSGEYATRRLRRDAVGLRRALAEVTSAPLRSALNDGPRLHLSRLDQPWSDALAMSLAVLRECEHIAGRVHNRQTDAFELSVRTDKLWERIIEQLLQCAGFEAVRSQKMLGTDTVADPWHGTVDGVPRTYPDFVAYLADELVVVDAKYKMRETSSAPSRDDQYQMFAYSHLVADKLRRPDRVILLYPGSGQGARWYRGRDGAIPLDAFSIPFPQPADVRTGTAFAQYLDCAGMRLTRQLRLVRAGG